MKLQTRGYGIPSVQMWSQQETDCLCKPYFNASHEGALFWVICSVHCIRKDVSEKSEKLIRVRGNFSPCSTKISHLLCNMTTTNYQLWGEKRVIESSVMCLLYVPLHCICISLIDEPGKVKLHHMYQLRPHNNTSFVLNCLKRQTAGRNLLSPLFLDFSDI